MSKLCDGCPTTNCLFKLAYLEHMCPCVNCLVKVICRRACNLRISMYTDCAEIEYYREHGIKTE